MTIYLAEAARWVTVVTALVPEYKCNQMLPMLEFFQGIMTKLKAKTVIITT